MTDVLSHLPDERVLHQYLAVGLLLSVAGAMGIAFPLGIKAPYGRYAAGLQGKMWTMNAKLAWTLQELPAFVVPVVCWVHAAGTQQPPLINCLLLGLFVFHYFYRSLVFPFRIRGGKPTHLSVVLASFAFCSINGYLVGRSLTAFDTYSEAWLADPRFVLGALVFLTGWSINYQADGTLRNLRKPGETGYKIPRGGMFEYVTAANYLGEIVEWSGFAIACWNFPAVVFALNTAANLIPRAVDHHRWYLEKFPDYPKDRRVVVPFFF